MKKFICLIATLMLCVASASFVFAENSFVPSISYKDGPEIKNAVLTLEGDTPHRENIHDCVIISSISDAKLKTTDICQPSRDLLLEVYEKLATNSMELPLEGNKYVIRELVDISFKNTSCIGADHIHEDELNKDSVVATIDFDLGINANTDLVVLIYRDGQWTPAQSVVNNGDGTVTCVLEYFCPVAFCVAEIASSPQTGDDSAANLNFWIAAMAGSFIGLVLLAVGGRKEQE